MQTVESLSSRDVKTLCSQLRGIFIRFDSAMREAKIDYIVTCTYRSNTDQTRLYAQGRTTKGAIVTNAKAGESEHNAIDSDGVPASRAFDIVVMKDGKPDWDKKNPAWKIAGKIGVSVGLTWAGNWKSFQEYPHFQLPESQ